MFDLAELERKHTIPPPDPNPREESITLTAREILEKKIDIAIQKYPTALRPEHIQNILDCSQSAAYKALPYIPGAKKLPGLGWRIPRETFFAWWYGKEAENEKN